VIGYTCMLLCGSSCVCFSRSRPRVPGQHPAFPAPSWTKRVERQSKARANCAARTGRRVC